MKKPVILFVFVFLITASGCTTFGGYLVTGDEPFLLTVDSLNNLESGVKKWVQDNRKNKGSWTRTINDDTYLLISAGIDNKTAVGLGTIRQEESSDDFILTVELRDDPNARENERFYRLFLIQPSVSDENLEINYEYPESSEDSSGVSKEQTDE